MICEVDGVQLYYEATGDGDPLLLLHGGTGIGADWQHVFTAGFPPACRTIVPDLRGHGRSTGVPGRYTFAQVARDMVAQLNAIGIPRVKAIGMSAGAKTLLHMATLS